MAKRSKPDWSAAKRHLSRAHPRMKRIIARVGACSVEPRPPRDYFPYLCRAIFAQQVSTHVANITFERFKNLFPRKRVSPATTIKLIGPDADESKLVGVGLSRQKRAYLLDLARHFERGQIPMKRFAKMTDDEIIDALTQVKGIGRWTAEMFLIFVLNRPDCWPVDDLGLREALKRFHHMSERPTPTECIVHGECFRPYRSIATWYFWRSLGN
jgi:DNA-3-methyladenine glycosylase II